MPKVGAFGVNLMLQARHRTPQAGDCVERTADSLQRATASVAPTQLVWRVGAALAAARLPSTLQTLLILLTGT